MLAGEINALEAFFDWYYPWAVTGAIWTVMTQVSHVQEDCQRPPSGDEQDDYFSVANRVGARLLGRQRAGAEADGLALAAVDAPRDALGVRLPLLRSLPRVPGHLRGARRPAQHAQGRVRRLALLHRARL
mmetsp:Transcript_25620/g.75641  ORF Transcript_25620/g.75641 Transcript_25620/m.75641 type:complete len:130 (-) Transcript_25620:415-804(-)